MIALPTAKNYQQFLREKVQPTLSSLHQKGYLQVNASPDIFYQFWLPHQTKAKILLLHGFGESSYKYQELVYYFLRENYAVFTLDLRGQGMSGRLGTDPKEIHITDFDTYLSDIKLFIDQIVQKHLPHLPLLLFTHSMSGALGATMLAQPNLFQGAVLSAPMFELKFHHISLEHYYSMVKIISKYPQINIPLLLNNYAIKKQSAKINPVNTHCAYRFMAYKALQKDNPALAECFCSLSWLHAAHQASKQALILAPAINKPILIMQARQDALVTSRAQNYFARRAPNCQLLRFEKGRHELYRENNNILQPYLECLFRFYDTSLNADNSKQLEFAVVK